jgi:low temperature requirement protein LtrA
MRAWSNAVRPTTPDHRVTSLELFFDLVFVFAFTQVTAGVAADPSMQGAVRGLLVFGLLWWAWCSYAWLGNHVQADEGLVRLALIVAMFAMTTVALAIPEAWADLPGGIDSPLALAVALTAVRFGHLAVYFIAAGADRGLRMQLVRTAIPVAIAAVLLLAGAMAQPQARLWWWVAALAVDYAGIYVAGADGWRLPAPRHFAERHSLIVIVALGESVIAIGVGIAEYPLSWLVLGATMLALAVTVCLWWVYFDVVVTVAEHQLLQRQGAEQTRMARDSYTYLHFLLVGGVLASAVGVKKALGYIADPAKDSHSTLHGVPAWLLVGGVASYLLGLALIRWRNLGTVNVQRLVAVAVLLAMGFVVGHVPVIYALALVAAVPISLVSYEVTRFGAVRDAIRHGGQESLQPPE